VRLTHETVYMYTFGYIYIYIYIHLCGKMYVNKIFACQCQTAIKDIENIQDSPVVVTIFKHF